MQGWVDLGTAVSAQPVPKSAYQSGCRDTRPLRLAVACLLLPQTLLFAALAEIYHQYFRAVSLCPVLSVLYCISVRKWDEGNPAKPWEWKLISPVSCEDGNNCYGNPTRMKNWVYYRYNFVIIIVIVIIVIIFVQLQTPKKRRAHAANWSTDWLKLLLLIIFYSLKSAKHCIRCGAAAKYPITRAAANRPTTKFSVILPLAAYRSTSQWKKRI